MDANNPETAACNSRKGRKGLCGPLGDIFRVENSSQVTIVQHCGVCFGAERILGIRFEHGWFLAYS